MMDQPLEQEKSNKYEVLSVTNRFIPNYSLPDTVVSLFLDKTGTLHLLCTLLQTRILFLKSFTNKQNVGEMQIVKQSKAAWI